MLPKYNELYLSVLKSLSDRQIHTTREITDFVALDMNVDAKERQNELLSSGMPVFSNRVHWACTYLKKAGLLESAGRGRLQLTKEGYRIFTNPPASLDNQFLSRYPSFQAFRSRPIETADNTKEADETPNDLIDQSISALNQKLADDLMAEIMAKDPAFFESLVVKLMVSSGKINWDLIKYIYRPNVGTLINPLADQKFRNFLVPFVTRGQQKVYLLLQLNFLMVHALLLKSSTLF